ncbi:MAG: hypothetical protein IT210_24260 [Armatimonadetes bacterium]|nr:hypothetical protein [Armatimonadota bacterium]
MECDWASQWLFWASSVRYASAITGAPDYAAFENGWWHLTATLRKMYETVKKRQTLFLTTDEHG